MVILTNRSLHNTQNQQKSGVFWKNQNFVNCEMLQRFCLFYSKIAKDEKRFDLTDVLNSICEKLIRRHPHIYGDVNFWLFNVKTEEGLSNAKVFVDNHETISDEDGNVSVFIPLSEQKTRYRITSTISLLDSIVTMPCSKDFIIKVAD